MYAALMDEPWASSAPDHLRAMAEVLASVQVEAAKGGEESSPRRSAVRHKGNIRDELGRLRSEWALDVGFKIDPTHWKGFGRLPSGHS